FLQRLDLIGFDADERVLSQPIDLLANGRKTVQVIALTRDANGHDVGLAFPCAGESREMFGCEECETVFARQLPDKHDACHRLILDGAPVGICPAAMASAS